MRYEVSTVDEYYEQIPEERKQVMNKLRNAIKKNLPKGFSEELSYGMPGFVVPHSIYPAGYHCKPSEPLPFMSIASQKNFIAVYHMAVYADPELMDWFVKEYPKHSDRKLDMGKSCIRFKKMDDVPVDLIGELASKVTVEDWIAKYESAIKR